MADFWVRTEGTDCGGGHLQLWRPSHGAHSIARRKNKSIRAKIFGGGRSCSPAEELKGGTVRAEINGGGGGDGGGSSL